MGGTKKLVLAVSATAFRSLAARGWDPFGWRFGISGGRRKGKDGGNGDGMAIFLWVSWRKESARARMGLDKRRRKEDFERRLNANG